MPSTRKVVFGAVEIDVIDGTTILSTGHDAALVLPAVSGSVTARPAEMIKNSEARAARLC
jgi:hypothetical protein